MFDLKLTFTLAPIRLLAALGERTALPHPVTNAGALFDRLFVLDSGGGFFGHPRGVKVPKDSTQIAAPVNS